MHQVTIEGYGFAHFIIVDADDKTLAWTGSRFTRQKNGRPAADTQICNFITPAEAADYIAAHKSLELAQPAPRKRLAALTVSALYAGFSVEMLERILAVGVGFDVAGAPEEVRLMNEALAAEIERRKAGR
jgi:hypothetical protein